MPHTKTVTISELRKDLARLVASVRYGSDFVVIRRKAEDNVYLISQADWDLLDRKIDELETGRWCDRRKRMVGGLMSFLRREKSLERKYTGPDLDAAFARIEEDKRKLAVQEEAEEAAQRDRFNAVIGGSLE